MTLHERVNSVGLVDASSAKRHYRLRDNSPVCWDTGGVESVAGLVYLCVAGPLLLGGYANRSWEAAMADEQPRVSGRSLVVCLDGTSNEPEADVTNVARLFDMALKDQSQLVYYDPGVGTMGARSATTPLGRSVTRAAGLVVGFGVRENVAEAYAWLMEHYRPGDRIYLFGFSRGAYTALAVAGMLRTLGLLSPGAVNLVPYALKMYARNTSREVSAAEDKKYWDTRAEFNRKFGNPDFERFARNITFLGLWDTVKFVGWLNARARFEQAHWPFTRNVKNVAIGRLAIAIDENRRPFGSYRFDPQQVAERPEDLKEVWFAGVHMDVGGQHREHRLSDIALGWMTDEAMKAGLRVDAERYERLVGVPPGTPLPASSAVEGIIHRHRWYWALAGGWGPRRLTAADVLHPSVQQRIDGTAGTANPYRPRIEG